MFEAELAHKLPELKSREDYLTSCVFGCLKYVPPTRGILQLLSSAVNYRVKTDFAGYLRTKGLTLADLGSARLYFWPRSAAYGEPDLVLVSEGDRGSFLIAIEVKYFSGKHGEGEKDQLARYYLALEGVEGRRTFDLGPIKGCTGEFLALVYVTQYEAEMEIEETLGILESEGIRGAEEKFFHLRWPDIAKGVKAMLAKADGEYEKAICRDIEELLEFRNLTPFSQFSALPTLLSPELLMRTPVFFQPEDRRHRGFSGFPRLPREIAPQLLEAAHVFFRIGQGESNSSLFNGFSRAPMQLRLRYRGHIYYGG